MFTYIAKEIKQTNRVKISVEIIPPAIEALEQLCETVDSLIMSIEVWDEKRRQKIAPGKFRLAKKEQYIESWKAAIKMLGRGNVGSVLIVGLEDKESTLEGAKKMIEMGVIPTLLPFRPLDSIPLKHYAPVNPEQLMEMEKEVSFMLRENNLNPKNQAGCTACGGCSIEIDMINKPIIQYSEVERVRKLKIA